MRLESFSSTDEGNIVEIPEMSQSLSKLLFVTCKPVSSQVAMCPNNVVLKVVPFQAELVLLGHPFFLLKSLGSEI